MRSDVPEPTARGQGSRQEIGEDLRKMTLVIKPDRVNGAPEADPRCERVALYHVVRFSFESPHAPHEYKGCTLFRLWVRGGSRSGIPRPASAEFS